MAPASLADRKHPTFLDPSPRRAREPSGGDPRADPGPSVAGRCAWCRVRFHADPREGVYLVACPLARWHPCDLGGIPHRRKP